MGTVLARGNKENLAVWKTAYEEHGQAIKAFLASRLKNQSDAEDLLQETFVRAIRATNSLRNNAKVRPYLFSIAHNLMVNFVRRKKEFVISSSNNEGNILENVVDEYSESPEDVTSLHDLEKSIDEVMDLMTPAHKKAFELGVILQKPYSEIATLTGWSLAQVKINVYRARKKAIEELKDEWKAD